MYGADKVEENSDLDRTAFRNAEKKYKLYYDTSSKRKKKKPRAVDLSDVLDFKSILEGFEQNGVVPNGVKALPTGLGLGFHRHVFCLETRPGFYFIPGALNLDEQCRLIKESLTEFPQPPNRTNHNAMYGPIHNLFAAAKEGKVLTEENSLMTLNPMSDSVVGNGHAHRWKFVEANTAALKGNGGNAASASVLLRKLRWSTLGLQFDWSQRNYDVSLPHNTIPGDLCELAKRLATPAMPAGEEFKPEAAIVNYFGLGDTLGGHCDDVEKDWSKPIVSMSLGCKAIFLLGGKTRHDPPIAMFLRTGDVVLMAGEARECFHGVCRIFTDMENAEITPLEMQFSCEEDRYLSEYIRNSRININIRQVF